MLAASFLALALLSGMEPDEVRIPPKSKASNVIPSYPPELLRRGVEGKVLLRLLISDEGKVLIVRVEKSSGHKAFDDAALDAVRKWRFEPATVNGTPIQCQTHLPFTFYLQPVK